MRLQPLLTFLCALFARALDFVAALRPLRRWQRTQLAVLVLPRDAFLTQLLQLLLCGLRLQNLPTFLRPLFTLALNFVTPLRPLLRGQLAQLLIFALPRDAFLAQILPLQRTLLALNLAWIRGLLRRGARLRRLGRRCRGGLRLQPLLTLLCTLFARALDLFAALRPLRRRQLAQLAVLALARDALLAQLLQLLRGLRLKQLTFLRALFAGTLDLLAALRLL